MLRVLPSLALAGLAFVAACAAPIEISRDFVTLADHDDDDDFRAITADDGRLWLRSFDDPNAAGIDFWAATLEREFVEQRGYELLDQGAAFDADRREGRWLEFAANVDGERVGYLLAIWVDGGEVRVVEFAARDAVFAARVADVRAALRTVRG
ncbi:MAG: hypothetical protein KDE27_24070 [Planctomycetes bacterium]|nr:hypothetical protein [Planctomycetota bacterium]